MSFLQYRNTQGALRFVYEDYDYTPLISDPNPSAGRLMAVWQPIPLDTNSMLDYISLYRRRRPQNDEKRPFIVTRTPHTPPLDSQLVIRFQGIVKKVDFSILGNWDKTTQRSSCARAVRSITLGADTTRSHLWRETIGRYNTIREAIRHHLAETGDFSHQIPFASIPEADHSVLKFEQRVFRTDGEVRYAPDYLGVNDKLDQIGSRWHLTEQVSTLRSISGGPNVEPVNARLIAENDFVDIAAVIQVTVNLPRGFYLSLEVLRTVQLRPAVDVETDPEDLDNEDLGTGPVIDNAAPVPIQAVEGPL